MIFCKINGDHADDVYVILTGLNIIHTCRPYNEHIAMLHPFQSFKGKL